MGGVAKSIGQLLPIAAAIVVNLVPGIGTLASALIIGGAAILGGFLTSLMQPMGAQSSGSGTELMLNSRQAQRPVPIIYGTRKLGSNDVFLGTSGKENKYLWIIHALCEGPIEGIAYNEETGQPLIDINDEPLDKVADYVSWWFYNGTSDQPVPPELNEALPEYTDTLPYTAYLLFKIKYKASKFYGIPKRLVTVKGRRVFDFRDHVIKFSSNPVLVLYDYMVGDAQSGHYGLRFPTDAFEMTSWIDSANYCDEAEWEYNDIIYKTDSAIAIIQKMLSHFRGVLGWDQGQFWLRYIDVRYEISVYHITNDQISQDDNGQASVNIKQASRFSLPDGMKVRWTDPNRDWTVDEAVIGNPGQVQELDLSAFIHRKPALNMGFYNLERSRANRIITFSGRDDLLQLEHHDLVNFDCNELGLTNRLMRVESQTVSKDGLIGLTLAFEREDFYDEKYDERVENRYEQKFGAYDDAPPDVINVTVIEERYDYRGRTMIRLLINFDPPPNYEWYDHVSVYFSLDLGDTWRFYLDTETNFMIDNVQEGATYYIRLHTVSVLGVSQTDEEAVIVSHYVVGISEERPPSVEFLWANPLTNAIALYSDPIDSPDIANYEFRLGASWREGLKVAAVASPSLSYACVKPGNHTFLLNTFGTNNLYGVFPRSGFISLQEPPAFHEELQRFPINFNTGTYNNTQVTPEGWLECAQIDDNLVGYYKSAVLDHVENEQLLIYVNYTYAADVSGLTWNDLVPIPETWEEDFIDKKWYEIFRTELSGILNIGLDYSTDILPPLEGQLERLELLTSTIVARSFQVRFKITDIYKGRHLVVKTAELVLCKQIEIE